ncbi:GGDEF domain-containing protein [Parahaliea aestuarii]|uniref:diguanylate cyclase n=1 Tax=Parahaliea aestuarii TaxID=1852021 RepID=A0A5C9A314_9GAMM|nr:GGDEF domain-containing protein [Parahaliea aestuarii]TXS94394.1 GGDEF domain-containing protein [Parahaliea aestuarii]
MIDYLLASLVVISIVLAGANYLAYRLFERPRHALMWAVAFSLTALQYLINLVREELPSAQFYWQSANMVSFALVLFALWGHRERLNLHTDWRYLLACYTVLSLLSAVFIHLYPLDSVRTALAPGFTFLAMTHIAMVLLRSTREPRLAQWVAAVIHLLFGLTQGLSAAIALNLDSDSREAMTQLYNTVNFGLMPTLFIALGISVIFLLATDLASRLSTMALVDSLTQLNNRRGYLLATESLWARCRRNNKPLSLMIADIDYFKRINDRYGHSIGDRALQHFARILRESVRVEDALGRIGGEEFAVTFGEKNSAEVEAIATRFRAALAREPLCYGSVELELRASFGIAEWQDKDDLASLLKRADIALYEAKAAGRDAVMVSGDRSLVGMASNG